MREDARAKLEHAKKLTAMLNFNTIGCKVGEASLKVWMKITQKKRDEEKQVQQKKDKNNYECKQFTSYKIKSMHITYLCKSYHCLDLKYFALIRNGRVIRYQYPN